MSKPLLGYWDIRGLAEPIRLMLEHCGVDYDQRLFVCGPGPEFKRNDWTDVKDTFGLDFPNIPFYVDGEMRITESWAIMKYIGRNHSTQLLPADERSRQLADQSQGVVDDFRKSFTALCYGADFADKRASYLEQLDVKLARFDAYLARHRWLAGDQLTYVDFAFAEILDQIQLMETAVYKNHGNVAKYLSAFMTLDRVKAYRSSPRFKKFPCNNKRAQWGGQAE